MHCLPLRPGLDVWRAVFGRRNVSMIGVFSFLSENEGNIVPTIFCLGLYLEKPRDNTDYPYRLRAQVTSGPFAPLRGVETCGRVRQGM